MPSGKIGKFVPVHSVKA